MKDLKNKYDVAIIGGGLAGLSLALQLKTSDASLNVLIIEKRAEIAPVATHKVGESIVELGSYYLREVVGLKEYLIEKQLPKFGFRYFFAPGHLPISKKVELGAKTKRPVPSHHIDRGILENELIRLLEEKGVTIETGSVVKDADISENGHSVTFIKNNESFTTKADWLVDSSGRSSFLKRKLNLHKDIDHNINAVWFRICRKIDVDDWSADKEWQQLVPPGFRALSTNHLMGKGYWVWIIPLVSGCTSIGIVADPEFHPLEHINTFEKAAEWLKAHEPDCYFAIDQHKDEIMDFKMIRNFAYDSKSFFSAEKWAVTGEAGAFMDAFYSPGTDFIALSNSWITDLINRSKAGEDIYLPAMTYENFQRQLIDGWMLLYRNMYSHFGNTQVMILKLAWDWSTYWAVPSLLFMNKGYTDLAVIKIFSASQGIGQRFALLNKNIQKFFQDWSEKDNKVYKSQYIDLFMLDHIHLLHQAINTKYNSDELVAQLKENFKILEIFAASIMRFAFARDKGFPEDLKIDPYQVSFNNSYDEIIKYSNSAAAIDVFEKIDGDLKLLQLKYELRQNSVV